MAVSHLTAPPSPKFPQASGVMLPTVIASAERAFAERHLTRCYYEDRFGQDCKQLATVHLLGSDYDYCLTHFRKVSR